MDVLIFPYLPICSNENVSDSNDRFNVLLNIKLTLKQLAKIFKMLTLWQDNAKSGHTGQGHDLI